MAVKEMVKAIKDLQEEVQALKALLRELGFEHELDTYLSLEYT